VLSMFPDIFSVCMHRHPEDDSPCMEKHKAYNFRPTYKMSCLEIWFQSAKIVLALIGLYLLTRILIVAHFPIF
jgi:hypothetical protein